MEKPGSFSRHHGGPCNWYGLIFQRPLPLPQMSEPLEAPRQFSVIHFVENYRCCLAHGWPFDGKILPTFRNKNEGLSINEIIENCQSLRHIKISFVSCQLSHVISRIPFGLSEIRHS